jgi:hypothetical protein
MRSAAFAVEATLVFLASRINDKNDQNQFKFNSNSNKMRSAAFAVEATLVFLASRIN